MSGFPSMFSARARAILMLGFALNMLACGPREPEICRSTPPEDDTQYTSWYSRRQDAKCLSDKKTDGPFATERLRSPGAEDDMRIAASLPTLMDRAEAGDRKAIGDLIDYYWRDYRSPEQALIWTEKLGDLGDQSARESLFSFWQSSNNPKAPHQLKRLSKKWSDPKFDLQRQDSQ